MLFRLVSYKNYKTFRHYKFIKFSVVNKKADITKNYLIQTFLNVVIQTNKL